MHRHLHKGIQQWWRWPVEEIDGPRLDTFIPMPCSAACFLSYLQRGLQVKHCPTNSAPDEKFKASFLHRPGAQLSKQRALQLGCLEVKLATNLARCPPQHPLLGRWVVLCNTLSGVCSESSCTQPQSHSHEKTVTRSIRSSWTFLQFASTKAPRHGQKIYPGIWPGWSPMSSFHIERTSIGLLLWKNYLQQPPLHGDCCWMANEVMRKFKPQSVPQKREGT